jgi:hypothetical protein
MGLAALMLWFGFGFLQFPMPQEIDSIYYAKSFILAFLFTVFSLSIGIYSGINSIGIKEARKKVNLSTSKINMHYLFLYLFILVAFFELFLLALANSLSELNTFEFTVTKLLLGVFSFLLVRRNLLLKIVFKYLTKFLLYKDTN